LEFLEIGALSFAPSPPLPTNLLIRFFTFRCDTYRMNLLLIILLLLILTGGGGFYFGGPAVGGGGLGLVLLIVIVVYLAGGFRGGKR
jgi:hypothetical protein